MSALVILKNVCILEMKDTDPQLKKAIVGVFNAVQEDLDIHGFTQSSNVDDAMNLLDIAILKEDKAIEEETTQTENDKPITFTRIKDSKSEE